jgi:hypothetical protein
MGLRLLQGVDGLVRRPRAPLPRGACLGRTLRCPRASRIRLCGGGMVPVHPARSPRTRRQPGEPARVPRGHARRLDRGRGGRRQVRSFWPTSPGRPSFGRA